MITESVGAIDLKPVSKTLTASYGTGGADLDIKPLVLEPKTICIGGQHLNAAIGEDITPTLTSAIGVGGSHVPIIQTVAYGIPGNWIGRKPENGGNATTPMNDIAPCLTKTDVHGVAQTYTFPADMNFLPSFESNVSNTLIRKGNMSVTTNMRVRRLTPIECERLQGFPDNYTNTPTSSDTTRYKALGNSMAVPVMKWIGQRINELS